jgi:RND family efflux transporter MFP subunit
VAISAVQTADYNFRNSLLTYSNNVASASDALKQAQANLQDATSNARNALATAQISGNQQIALSKAKMDNARESLDLAQTQLNKVRTPARSEDLSLAQAQVDQANSALSLIRKQISDNILKAPMDGQISKINYDIGEQLSGAKLPLSMITENNFEIEIDISESDISKLQLNNQATITFDAFGEAKKFNGIVYFIEPASTIIQGVTYYKVKVKLTDTADYLKDVKEGMTANVTISTATKDNVLMVPRRSIVDKNDSHILRVMTDDKNYQEIPVELGLSGDEGMIEIISNQVKEGDPIVISIKAGS